MLRSKYISALTATIKQKTQATSECYIIRKKHSTKPKYYAMDWGDYRWVTDINEAMHFRSMQEINTELDATMVRYEAYFEIVKL
jgi:hypothetical protein